MYAGIGIKQSKVSLTNWKRLTNALLPLAGASAVEWNDHIFVLGHDGISQLYHKKSKIWSALPRGPYNSSNTTPPALTVHNGQILTMSKRGQIATYDPQLGDWTEIKDMNLKMENEWDCEGCILVSHNTNLYVTSDFEKSEQKIGTQKVTPSAEPTNTKCCKIHLYDPKLKSWTKVCEFGQGPVQSATVIGDTLFVHTGEEMYKVDLKKALNNQLYHAFQTPSSANQQPSFPTGLQLGQIGEGLSLSSKQATGFGKSAFGPSLPTVTIGKVLTSTPPKIASPPYEGFTLYAIKDTLFSFGGRDRDHQPTSDVLRYNPDTDTWESAGYMRSCRYNAAVTTMQDTTLEVFVVGGSFGSSEYTMKERVYTMREPVDTSIKPTRRSRSTGMGAGGLSQVNTFCWDSKISIVEKCTVN